MLMSATIFAMLITPHDRSIRAASGECHESKAPARWSSNGNSTALRPPPHWSTFEGGGLVLMFRYRCLFYRRIWKGGNNAIRQSIMSAPGLMVRTTDTELVADKVSNANLQEMTRSNLCKAGSTTFTFVREPLSHFLSGFTEYWFRSFKGRPASTSQSRSVLLTILHGGHIPGADNAPHMFLMAGVVVSGWKLDFVGTLDTIDHD